ncbi:hypothetical protein NN3_35950 [Nocardia neocaledoniensis NBRC 108232]|uniref:Uncharacterized protein n=1 Tax=Nocardia neocaledoniensis TaxID=236511 RepID=A0A317NC22_9NOCA|nr:hypothetical protein [Nocardia neocaledoniensis]PWV72739.1 hypothetical protein DFR69_10848 [Nocardia neocaledoniensis]GEM32588.1 hypothetical protein NN3_35950 [Nocardia neocaledoniensis NBRC 108232]
MQVGDLVRIGTNGISQFGILKIDGTHARIEPTLQAPGAYAFSMRLIDLTPWAE